MFSAVLCWKLFAVQKQLAQDIEYIGNCVSISFVSPHMKSFFAAPIWNSAFKATSDIKAHLTYDCFYIGRTKVTHQWYSWYCFRISTTRSELIILRLLWLRSWTQCTLHCDPGNCAWIKLYICDQVYILKEMYSLLPLIIGEDLWVCR